MLILFNLTLRMNVVGNQETMAFKTKVVSWLFSFNSKATQLVVGNSSGSLSTAQPLGINIKIEEKENKSCIATFPFVFLFSYMAENVVKRFDLKA